ncbi:tetratricopeptide repeat protein [Alkalihalobacillus sp. LMS39]|uniref:tetratricopeptide repeat protein n=1 Tax=Alkalihalobacillus sp. LMS39 TaxID=2924032 RepID=UPI001FB1C25B|nr:tetratricopeptide repeat protein [Alkalihalobacillus sp. LMS39]UOE93747.1 tetratricopeptide repeat protein [Alkalihalobacillus sp. LMS39]
MKVSDHEVTTKKRGTVIPFRQTGDYFFDKGIKAYRKNNMKRALFFLQKAVEMKESEPAFYCQLAAVLAELGEFERSNEQLLYVLEELDPTLAECYFFLANNYAHLGFIDKAEEMVHVYLEEQPDGDFYDDALDLLEVLEFEREESEFFTEVDKETIIINKHDNARRYMESGKFPEAIQQLEAIIAEHPKFWAAYNQLAQALFLNHEVEKAISITLEVIEKDKGNLMALCNLADFYLEIGNNEEAKKIVSALCTVKPIDLDHRFRIATVFSKAQEFKKSYDSLITLQKHHYRESIPFLKCFAVAAYHCADFHKAEAAWNRASLLGDKEAETLLIRLLEKTLQASDVSYT